MKCPNCQVPIYLDDKGENKLYGCFNCGKTWNQYQLRKLIKEIIKKRYEQN